jgi:serine/threonine protein kinase
LKYLTKICAVLRVVAKALRHLHSQELVHGSLSLNTIGKYSGNVNGSTTTSTHWKLASVVGAPLIGQSMPLHKMGEHSPPEAVIITQLNAKSASRACFQPNLAAHPSIDVWAFGKVMFEALTGETLFAPGVELSAKHEEDVLVHYLGEWTDQHAFTVADRLEELDIGSSCAELVLDCLAMNPDDRFPKKGMDDILSHSFWKGMKQRAHDEAAHRHVRSGATTTQSTTKQQTVPNLRISTSTSSSPKSQNQDQASVAIISPRRFEC